MRWGDPLIDFPRILYASWRLSEGDQLYKDVIGQYGPLAYLAGGAGFRIFGVGINTMIGMNIVVAAVAVFLLRAIFRELGGRLMGWLAATVFINVFVFQNHFLIANYNFIAPYSAQATYGFVGLLLVLWGVLRNLATRRGVWLALAGFGLAVAYLDKPELIFAAVGTIAIFLALQILYLLRQSNVRQAGSWLARSLAWLGGGFLTLWLPVFGYFLVHGDWAYAWDATSRALSIVTNERVLTNVEASPLMLSFFGFDDPWGNFLDQLYSALILGVGCVIITWSARKWVRARAGSFAWAVWLLLALTPLLAAIAIYPDQDFWTDAGEAFAYPVFLATACYTWGCLRALWRRQGDLAQAMRLTVTGVAASLMLARIILNVRFGHFGFFMMPLTICFWLQVMVVEVARPVAGQQRTNWLAPAVSIAITFLGTAALAQLSYINYQAMTYEVGSGRDRFYTCPPTIFSNGWQLKAMLTGKKLAAPEAKLVAVLPGGVAVNYHLRVRSPFANLEVFPIAITATAAQRTLNALEANPPDLVMLYARDLSENGARYFGADRASGRDVLLWVSRNYQVGGYAGDSPFSITGHMVDFLIPNNQKLPPLKIVPVDQQ